MVRLIRHDANKPYHIKTQSGEDIYVCACGLSRGKPYCDGSHRKTQDEQPNEIYLYEGNTRIKLD